MRSTKISNAGSHSDKAALFDSIGEIASALASGRRGEIVDVLAQGERSVEELAIETVQSMANTSHHLRTLARAGLVLSRREGTKIYYRLAGPEVEEMWTALWHVTERVRDDFARLAEAYLGDVEELEVIGRSELLERIATGAVTVLDVRPVQEYRSGHIPGARTVPLETLAGVIDDLDEKLPVIAYCRGPFCRFAPAAVQALRAKGIDAVRLEDGFPEWRRAGLPIAVGDEPGCLPEMTRRKRVRGSSIAK